MSEPTNLPPSAAEMLLRARLAKELTLDQVSLQTRIPRDLIQALEEKNWTALPGAPYARAFCKTLAQAYELDSESVLAGLRNDMGIPSTKPSPNSTLEIRVPTSKEEAETSKTPLILAAILVIALVLVLAATRLAFKPSGAPTTAATDSSATDTLAEDTTGIDSLPATLLPISGPLAVSPKTVTVRLTDTTHPVFILYIRQGFSRIRKKNLVGREGLEFDPDTGILIRNLSKQPLQISGALKRDSVSNSYFKVYKKSDTVRFESISESKWDEKAGTIMDHKKHKNEN